MTTPTTPEQVAAGLGIVYNGLQPRIHKPPVHLWTDSKTGSTFATLSATDSDVTLKLLRVRLRFRKAKPGMFRNTTEAVLMIGGIGAVAALVIWLGYALGRWTL